jgi:hypothetical protein
MQTVSYWSASTARRENFDVCAPSYFKIREIWCSVAFEWRLSAAKFWCRAVNKSRQRTSDSRKHRSFVAVHGGGVLKITIRHSIRDSAI